MNQKNHYIYADGNGNSYTITPSEIAYDPVTPGASSSGTYSGGDPKTVAITNNQFSRVRNALQSAVTNPDILTNDRVMMSGVVTITTETGTTQYILRPGSNEIADIEKQLKEIIGQ